METNWTKKDLLAYLLIYCMRVDCKEQETEVDYIRTRVGDEVYSKAYAEFSKDNDYISIQKIQNSYKSLSLDLSEKDNVINDIKEIFEIDGHLDIIEQGIQMTLNRILKGL